MYALGTAERCTLPTMPTNHTPAIAYVRCSGVHPTLVLCVQWTTYRRMAEETVDAAVSSGRLPLNVRECVTRDLRLLGAQSYTPSLHAELAQQYRTAKGEVCAAR